MQTAASRMDVLDSVATARRGAGDCMSALHLSRRTLGYGAAALAGLLICRALMRASRPKVIVQAPVKTHSPWTSLFVQAVSMLVLPVAQAYILGNKKLPSISMPQLRMPRLPRMDFSYLFYRWLGLEK